MTADPKPGLLAAAAAPAVQALTPDAHREIGAFVRNRQTRTGGFSGRGTQPDLYYTMFAIDALRALDAMPQDPESLATWLAAFEGNQHLDFVDRASLCRARCGITDWTGKTRSDPQPVPAPLEAFRTRDGGYSHVASDSTHGTAYGALLAWLAYTETELDMPNPRQLADSLAALQMADGGVANERNARQGSTTATAAATVVWIAQNRHDQATRATRWLLGQAVPENGFRAAPGAPAPDLLSTATALFALRTADVALPETTVNGCRAMVESLWHDSGGFTGHADDPVPDVEYTFYALLALGITVPPTAPH